MHEIRDMEAFAKSQNAVEEIYKERRRQVDCEGWTLEHDDGHSQGELALAAATYAAMSGLLHASTQYLHACASALWPFNGLPKHENGNKRRLLIKAGALIIAEIERLDRQSAGGA